MNEDGDMRNHMAKFFDVIDKLTYMGVDINPDLLSIMLLQSLPSSYENCRCAIESSHTLLSPENLTITN